MSYMMPVPMPMAPGPQMYYPPPAPRRRQQQRRKPPQQNKKAKGKKPNPSPQAMLATAKTAVKTATTVPMEKMESSTKTAMKTRALKTKELTLQDVRGNLTQQELNQLYYTAVSGFNAGLGYAVAMHAATSNDGRVHFRITVKPPNSIADKLFKMHANRTLGASKNTDDMPELEETS